MEQLGVSESPQPVLIGRSQWHSVSAQWWQPAGAVDDAWVAIHPIFVDQ